MHNVEVAIEPDVPFDIALLARSSGADIVIALSGELDLATRPELERLVTTLVADRAERVELDLFALEFIDAHSAGLLGRAAAQLRADNRLLVLRSPNALVARVLRVLQIDEHARIEVGERPVHGAAVPVNDTLRGTQ